MSKPAAPICSSRLKSTVALNAALAYTSYCRLLPRLLRTRRVGRRLRQRTIEPIFGSLFQHYDLRRVNTRGGRSAHKTMLLTAIASTSRSHSSTSPQKHDAWPLRSLSHRLRGSLCAAGAGATTITTGLAMGSRNKAGVLQQPASRGVVKVGHQSGYLRRVQLLERNQFVVGEPAGAAHRAVRRSLPRTKPRGIFTEAYLVPWQVGFHRLMLPYMK